jgi:hypothetical protein
MAGGCLLDNGVVPRHGGGGNVYRWEGDSAALNFLAKFGQGV